jgi:hypothetical protein
VTAPGPAEFNPLDLAGAIAQLAAAYMTGDKDKIAVARENYQRVLAS